MPITFGPEQSPAPAADPGAGFPSLRDTESYQPAGSPFRTTTQEALMKVRSLLPALAVMVMVAPAAAQEMQHEHGDMAVAAVRPLYEQIRGWVIRSAEMMPEANYSFKPTPEVRSWGQLVGHVANASYMFCSGATGEASPNSTDAETLTSKADLVKAIQAAFAFCDSAYAMNDDKAMEQVEFFGQNGTRLWVLSFNVAHDFEHYGNMVTYLRLKGLTPPSTAGM